jgi:hypothetical protein
MTERERLGVLRMLGAPAHYELVIDNGPFSGDAAVGGGLVAIPEGGRTILIDDTKQQVTISFPTGCSVIAVEAETAGSNFLALRYLYRLKFEQLQMELRLQENFRLGRQFWEWHVVSFLRLASHFVTRRYREEVFQKSLDDLVADHAEAIRDYGHRPIARRVVKVAFCWKAFMLLVSTFQLMAIAGVAWAALGTARWIVSVFANK